MDYNIINEVEVKKQQRAEKDKDKSKKDGKGEIEEDKKEDKPVFIARTASDIQKRKLEKLMSDPTKEAYVPEPRKEWKPREPQEFIRDVMGSSAGAGSGEYHVYRNAKRREQKRLDYLDRKSLRDDLDEEFITKVEENKKKADEVTSKKRDKRQRKKQKKLLAKKMKKDLAKVEDEGEKSEESETEEKGNDDDDQEEETEDNEGNEQHFVIGGK